MRNAKDARAFLDKAEMWQRRVSSARLRDEPGLGAKLAAIVDKAQASVRRADALERIR